MAADSSGCKSFSTSKNAPGNGRNYFSWLKIGDGAVSFLIFGSAVMVG